MNCILEETPVFEWTENKLEEGLAQLWAKDRSQLHLLRRVIREMEESHMFHTLLAGYTDAHDSCRGDKEKEYEVFKAMLARMYIAGTVRTDNLINE